MKKPAILSLTLALSLALCQPAHAGNMDMSGMGMNPHAQAEGTEAVGVVDSADTAHGIFTISHEPIKSLDWPAMTMDFACKDKKLFGKLGKGKKVHFRFIEYRGNYVITDVK